MPDRALTPRFAPGIETRRKTSAARKLMDCRLPQRRHLNPCANFGRTKNLARPGRFALPNTADNRRRAHGSSHPASPLDWGRRHRRIGNEISRLRPGSAPPNCLQRVTLHAAEEATPMSQRKSGAANVTAEFGRQFRKLSRIEVSYDHRNRKNRYNACIPKPRIHRYH